jgi:hypothetical protein
MSTKRCEPKHKKKKRAFTSTNNEVAVNASETTPNDMSTLSLASELACQPACMQVPKVDFLKLMSDLLGSQKTGVSRPAHD